MHPCALLSCVVTCILIYRAHTRRSTFYISCLVHITFVSRADCSNMFYKARRIKLDHGYILTMFYASSNLCNNLHSFCSNLCVYYIIIVTTCMYINYYFVSTYMYKCIIILFIIIYLLYVGQLMCSTCCFCGNFFLHV